MTIVEARPRTAVSPVEPAVRHPRDVLRAAVGLAALALVSVAVADGSVGRFESNTFRLVNDLPHLLRAPLFVVMQLGSLSAVPVVVLVALAGRRLRLARDLALAGVSAWLLAKVVKGWVERPRPVGVLPDIDLHLPEPGGRGFPSGHVSVAAALAAVAWPYLSVRQRRLALAGVLVVGVARIYAGLHLPGDVVGGAALGLAVGAAVHLLLGAPGGRPAASVVRRALERAGVPVLELVTPALDARGSTPFLVRTADGRSLFVKAVTRTQRDADVLYRMWRYMVYRRPVDEFPMMTPKQKVQHEAHLSMLAERAGVRTPAVLVDIATSDGSALLVEQYVAGRTLATATSSELTDTMLVELWQQVATLRAARIAHRDLRLANVLVDGDDHPWVIDFGAAEAAAASLRLDHDVAELLAASAVVVGPERACHAACNGIGPDAVARALPLLQPMALTVDTRRRVARQPGLLDQLRETAAGTAGGTAPALERLPRMRGRSILLLGAAGAAVYALLPSLAELPAAADAARSARWPWLGAAAAASASSYLAAAVALSSAANRTLPLPSVVAGQLAATFANRFTPAGLGGLAVNTRLLVRAGLERAAAVAAVGLTSAVGVVVHVTALVGVAVALGSGEGDAASALRSALPTWTALSATAALLVVAALVVVSPFGRRRLLPPLRNAAGQLRTTLRQPRQAVPLLLGSAGVTLSYLTAFLAATQAFSLGLPALQVAAVYLLGTAVAAAAPTPSGLGAAEAALAAGLVAAGAELAPSVAAVLAFRLVTFWLPIAPGFLAFRVLRRREIL